MIMVKNTNQGLGLSGLKCHIFCVAGHAIPPDGPNLEYPDDN